MKIWVCLRIAGSAGLSKLNASWRTKENEREEKKVLSTVLGSRWKLDLKEKVLCDLALWCRVVEFS